MKALRIHGPSIIKIDEITVREPGEGEALIRIKAVGICNSDYELYTNEMIFIQNGSIKLPMIPGHEWSGVIEKLGPGVKRFKVGDRVTGECSVGCGNCDYCKKGFYDQCQFGTDTGFRGRDGAFAEYITFPESHLHNIGNMSFEDGAMIETATISLNGILKGEVSALDNVLITGPGPIGLMAAQIAKKVFNSKKVILSGTRDSRLEVGSKFGLDGVVNVKKENLYDKVRELTEGEMIDVIIETSASSNIFNEIQDLLKPCGRIVLLGFFGAREAKINWDAFTVKDFTLKGCIGSPAIWPDLISMVKSKKIDLSPLITHTFPLSRFEEGLNIMINRLENVIKVVINP